LNALNQVILKLYATTQSASASEFSENIFASIKSLVKFDSGGLCDFAQLPEAGLKLIAAVPHNVSTEDKQRSRTEYIDTEKVVGQNAIFTGDPLLKQAFRKKGNAVSLSVMHGARTTPNLIAYGVKTHALQSLAMVRSSAIHTSFQTISLWRAHADFEYTETDKAIADIILPHVFQAFSIHRQLHARAKNSVADGATAICSLSGHIQFIDPAAVEYLHGEFHDWQPPFLPPALLDHLRTTSEKIYITRRFTVVARLKEDLLFMVFRPSTSCDRLSATELVIAEMLARNDTYKAIAQRLGSQPATVRNQAHSIYVKFGISGKAQLARIMKDAGH